MTDRICRKIKRIVNHVRIDRKKRLVFLVDSSVQTFSRQFLSATAEANLLRDLASLVQTAADHFGRIDVVVLLLVVCDMVLKPGS